MKHTLSRGPVERIAAYLGFLACLGAAGTVLSGCEDESYSRDPSYLLEGGLWGVWELDHENGHGGPIPPQFERLDLRRVDPPEEPRVPGDGPEGRLYDANEQGHDFDLIANHAGIFGPWIVLPESIQHGWENPIYIGVESRGEPADDTLLVAFEMHDQGGVYPHSFKRVQQYPNTQPQ